ncbi:MAG: HypC/HybG/HupF family hydrogenase formation chaperone [Planctomycetes bacterium]|jgi:hydrogenase expression/formation protein HypC|nr:HypC/HybG/HupF family hydrogenase formation chaperone [Planctomycetota bacterium]
MCLAVPVKIVSIEGSTAVVDAGGNLVKADVSLVDGVRPGDYVILHAGFAIQKYSPEEAEETLRLFREIEEKAAEMEGGASRTQGRRP